MSVNEIIAGADESLRLALQPHLRDVALFCGDRVHRNGDLCETVYFPTTAVLSRISRLEGSGLEVDTLGRFEAAGLLGALAGAPSSGDIVVQISGSALAIESGALRDLVIEHPALLRRLLGAVARADLRTDLKVGCGALHNTDQRLAFWLLQAQDRVGQSKLKLTQGALARALGVQRTTLNAAALMLKRARAIRYARGGIEIVDRAGLLARSCACYGALKSPEPEVEAVLAH